MIQKKVCLLGAFSVGKTSLVRRYVSSLFTERYLTTVGVKIDKKLLCVDGTDLMLMLWDLAGEDDFTEIRTSYLRGTSVCVVVVDRTRAGTFDTGRRLVATARDRLGDAPVVVAINKADLDPDPELAGDTLHAGFDGASAVVETSAATGESVDALFETVGRALLARPAKAA